MKKRKIFFSIIFICSIVFACSTEEEVDCEAASKMLQADFEAWYKLEPQADLSNGLDASDCAAYNEWLIDYENAYKKYVSSFKRAKSCSLVKSLLSGNGYAEDEVDKYLAEEKGTFDESNKIVYAEFIAGCN